MYSLCMTSPSVSAETSQQLCEVAAVSIDTPTLQMSTLKLENLSGLSRVTQQMRGRAENSRPARLAAVSILLPPVSLPPLSTVLSCQQHPRYHSPTLFPLHPSLVSLFLFNPCGRQKDGSPKMSTSSSPEPVGAITGVLKSGRVGRESQNHSDTV